MSEEHTDYPPQPGAQPPYGHQPGELVPPQDQSQWQPTQPLPPQGRTGWDAQPAPQHEQAWQPSSQQPGWQTPAAEPRRGLPIGAVIAAALAGSIVGGLLVGLVLLFLAGSFGQSLIPQQPQSQSPGVAATGTPAPSEIATSPDADQPIEAVAARVTPSVVNVAIEQTLTDPFTGATRTQVTGNGSGVIIRADGYILTNNHVVSGASKILVTIGLQNLPARVVGTDPASDIAVVKVEKTGLPAAQFGDSESLKVGETVVAIGSPFGLDKTVTSGIISALHRTGQATDQTQQTVYGNLIQTDAPINPGNSGGALADLGGRVIGVNTLIQTGGAQQSAGIGFAIPIKIASQVADQLIKTGRATHTFLGVAAVDVDAGTAPQLGLGNTTGALVQDVQQGSPAEKAGIKRGDVITKVGNTAVQNSQEMVAAIRSYKPGDKVTIEVVRGGKPMKVDVTLGSAS